MGNRLRETFSENSCYKIFFLSLLITGLSFGIYKGLQDNYLAEVVSMGELDRGITEFFRELPGLLLIFILIVFYTFSAETMYKIGATVTLLGVAMLAIVPPVKVLVIVSMFVHSLGDHIQLGMKNTLTLNYARPGKGGVALGYQNSIHQVGTLAGYLVVVLAFAHMKVLSGEIRKPKEDQMELLSNILCPSPWMQIETAFARSLGLPCLIISEDEGLLRNGIFDEALVQNDPSMFFVTFVNGGFSNEDRATIEEWVRAVEACKN